MGQPHSTVLASASNGFSAIGTDGQLHELDNDVFYQKSLGNGQFMKTIRCRHPREGPIVVKLFIKPGSNVSLHNEVALVKSYHCVLKQLSSVLSYPVTVETPSAIYLVRQYLYSNLYDRISTRPFLSHLEKKWITFQLLCSMRDIHRLNVCHGDIKCENVLISSWNWSYLCDFAPYKPTYLPEDNPADFSYFFDTSARRTCYVAPERFVPSPTGDGMGGDASVIDPSYLDGYPTAFTTLSRQGPLVPAMDVFSLGCVIAELFLEGKPIFTLSQLLQYKSGEYDPTPELAKIGDEQVQSLIQSMIHPEPTQRLTAEECLQQWQGTLFPSIFASFLYPYMTGFATFLASLNPPHKHPGNSHETSGLPTDDVKSPHVALSSQDETDPAHQLAALYFSYSGAAHQEASEPVNAPPTLPTTILCCSDARIDRVYHDWNVICHNMGLHDATNPPSATENHPVRTGRPQVEGSIILVNLITSCLRNAAYPTSKRHGLELLYWLAYNISDELILNRVVPHVLSILTDYSALVRQTAVYVLIQVLSMVTTLTPVNAHIFGEYLLPHIRPLVRDPQPMVRIALASSVTSLAQSAQRFVAYKAHHQQMSRQEPPSSSSQKNGVSLLLGLEATALPGDQGLPTQTLDTQLWELRKQFQHIITQLLTDSNPNVKRALLADMIPLAVFFGRTLANDFLLSHVITFLNDRDWLLRGAFFEAIVGLATVVGPQSLELYILPLMIQALTDSHEWVVEKVLHAFTSLTRVGLFAKTTLWDLLNLVLPLLYHPNLWIRYEAVVLVVAITDQLPDVDKWCLVLPALQPFLKMDILDITPDSLQQALKPPITRRLLQEVLTKPADKVDQSPKLAPMSRSSGSGGGLEGEFDHRLSLSPHSSPRLLPWPLYHANDSQDSIDLSGAAQRGDDQFRRGGSFTSGPGDITLTGDEDRRIPAQWTHLRHAEPQDIPKLEALAFYINRVRDTYRQFTALEQARQLGALTNRSSQEPVGRSTQHRTSSEGVTHPVGSQAERMNSVELRDLGLTPHTEFLTPWDAVRPLYSAAWFAAGPGLDQPTAKFSMLPMLRSESNPEYRRNSTDRQWESVSNTSISANPSTNPIEMASPALPPSQWLSSPLVSARSPASTISLPGLHAEISARKPSIAEKGTTVHNVSLTKAQPSVALASVDPSVQLPCSRAGVAKGGDTSKQVLESLNQVLHHRPSGGYRQQRSASVQYSGNRVPGHRLLHRPRFADTPMQKYRHVFSGTTGGGYFDNYIPTPGAKPDLLSRVGGEGWRELSEMMATGPDTEAAVAGRVSGSAVTWAPHTTSFPLMSPTSALHWLIHYDAGQTIKRLLRKKALEVFPRSFPELGPPTNASLLTQHRRLIQEAIPSLQNWRPEGTLVAYFKEHTGAINQIALSSDHAKFATASNDGTVLVWDCTRLDKQVLHRAQASYQVGARVESITFIHNTYSMAAVGDDGSVHLIRLECSDTNYQPLCGECRLVRRCQFPPGEYAVQVKHVHSESTSYLLTATTRSRLVALDLRTLTTVWTLEVPPRYGLLTCFLVDPRRTWLLVGTASGVLVLWDLRFRIPVKAWQHPAQSRIYQLQMFLTALSQGRLVLVAAGRNEVSVWDVAQARCREVFCGSREWPELQDDLTHHSYQALDPPTIESALCDMIPYNTDLSTLSLGTDSGGSPGGQRDLLSPLAAGTNVETAARAIVFPANSSYFLVAGTDHKIRYWDLECIEQSYIISGDTPKFMGRPRYQYTTHRVQGIAFHTESRSPADGASSARSPLPRAVRQSQEPSATNTVPFRSSEDSGKHPLTTSILGTHSHKYHVRSSKGGGYFAHLQSVLANHEDCITAMQLTEVPYPMIISGARNGVLRLYL